ncbi:transcriptional regulator [Sphingomonas sanguinis]|uniref:transcriptional regulator n=1 Tax=Sphingomonas sanguinis TaxID=33051 RepID=UPI0009ECD904
MSLEHQINSVLAEAVRAAGNQTAFGRLIGKRQSSVREWLKNDRPLPAEHVLAIEEATGISRHRLRPDIYPEPTSSVLPGNEVVEGGAPIENGNRRAEMQCVKP